MKSNPARDLCGECCRGLPSAIHDYPRTLSEVNGTVCSLHKCINAEPSSDCVGRASQPQDPGCCTLCQGSWSQQTTLPPHCTHKMQRLKRCFFKSLKNAYNVSADNLMTSHHGQRISLDDMKRILGNAFLRTSTPDKAINGFRACGLWPFDDTIFQDNEFAAAALREDTHT